MNTMSIVTHRNYWEVLNASGVCVFFTTKHSELIDFTEKSKSQGFEILHKEGN